MTQENKGEVRRDERLVLSYSIIIPDIPFYFSSLLDNQKHMLQYYSMDVAYGNNILGNWCCIIDCTMGRR